MHRAHRAENHSLRLSLSPFSGLSSFSPWLTPSYYKKVFPSTVLSSHSPFQPTGQEAHSDFKGVLNASATTPAQAGRTERTGRMGRLCCTQALGYQDTGHSWSFCSKQLTATFPALASTSLPPSPTTCTLRRWTSQAHAPSCAPVRQVPALLDLQSLP